MISYAVSNRRERRKTMNKGFFKLERLKNSGIQERSVPLLLFGELSLNVQ